MQPVAAEERLGYVLSALEGVKAGSPFAMAAARALLNVRDLTEGDARVRLEAERIVLEEIAVKGRGGRAVSVPRGPAPAAQPGMGQPGLGGQAFDEVHPRGTGGKFMRKGDSGPHVQAMQARLTELGQPAGQDGKFGPKEQTAVKALQKQYGLPQSGIVDQRTLEMMRTPPAQSNVQQSAGLRAALLAAGQTAAPGQVGPNVATLQQALMALGFQVTDPQSTYGPSTEAAVRALQQKNGLAPTGRMDEQTAAVLAQQTPTMENQGGNIAGDSLATWGLKPLKKHEHDARPSGAARGNSRSKPNPRPGRAATGKGGTMKEATYDGSGSAESPSGGIDPTVGIDPAVARTARILDLKPPGLRASPADSFAACSSCVWYGGGDSGCEKYGGFPVNRNDLCDDWLTLTPEQDRPKENDYDGLSYVKGDALDGIDPDKLAESTLTAAARKKLKPSDFAIPPDKYPIHDEAHARNALARVAQNGSPAEQSKVRAAVKKKYPGIAIEESRVGGVERAMQAIQETWSPQARAAAILARREHAKLGPGEAEKRASDAENHIQGAATQEEREAWQQVAHHFWGLAESRDVAEAKSDVYPDLSRTNDDPNANWVAKAGGLPSYIERIAKHLHYEQGKSISEAIQIAVGVVKRWCAGGSASTKGGASTSHVTAKTKAQACAAVASWEAKKASSKGKTATKKVSETATLEEAMTVAYAAELEANPTMLPPSIRFCEKLLAAVQESYSDWDEWGDDGRPPERAAPPPTFTVWVQESAVKAVPSFTPDPSLEPFLRSVPGGSALMIAGVPVRLFESAAAAAGAEAAAKALDVRKRGKNATRTRNRSAGKMQRGFHPAVSEHNPADLAVHAAVSKRFAGPGAKPTTLAADCGSQSEMNMAVEDDDPQGSAGDRNDLISEGIAGLFNSAKHPRGRAGKFADVLGRIDVEAKNREGRDVELGDHERRMIDQVEGRGGVLPQDLKANDHFQDMAGRVYHVDRSEPGRNGKVKLHLSGRGYGGQVGPPVGAYSFEPVDQGFRKYVPEPMGVAKPPTTSAASEGLTVDQAIGNVLGSYPGLDDWSVEQAEGGWHVKVTMPDAKMHHFHVADSGEVALADEDGKPKSTPKSEAKPPAVKPAAPGGSYELTGEHEKPYHMADGQVFQGKKGGWFEKVTSGPMTSESGWKGAGVHVHDLSTGEKRWVPAFAMKDHLPLAGPPGSAKKAVPAKSGEALFGDLMSSVNKTSSPPGSFSGKNVVVTGKIPGYTRDDVHAMVAAKGGKAQSSVGADTHVLITGEKVGATKTQAALSKGVQVMPWESVKHLLEADLGRRVQRLLSTRAELEEASAGEVDGLNARIDVLVGRMDDSERRTVARLFPKGLARFGVVSESVVAVHRRS